MKKFFTLFMILGFFMFLTGPVFAKTVTILYSGESHAALEHCDCPIAPNGGLRRRASVIKETRRRVPDGEILLLDTGGMFAGGIYDENISGPGPDGRRTAFTLKATKLLGYNAAAISDEELAYGKEYLLKQKELFLSANVFDLKTDRLLFAPYKIFQIQGVRFGVIGLSPLPPPNAAAEIKVGDPMAAAREVVANIRPKVDVVVVLSPLGEANSKKLLQETPGIDILLNGDEFSTNQVYQQVAGSHFFQFFFQGRSMGRIDVSFDENNKINDIKADQIALSDAVPDDQEISALLDDYYLKEKKIGDARIKLDLYVMSHNPNSREALAALAPLLSDGKLASRIDWDINFIAGIKPDGSIWSTNGPAELAEDARQLLIAKYLPDVFWNYLTCQNSAFSGSPWQECLGRDAKLIEDKIASGEGENLLREDIKQLQSVRIHTAPTIFINNHRYHDHIHTLAFLKNFCSELDPKGVKFSDCKQLPECFQDNDCDEPGMLGTCHDKGEKTAVCKAEKAVGVTLTVIYDPRTMVKQADQAVAYLRNISPGIEEERIDYQTEEGKNLVDRYGINRIPAFLTDRNLSRIKRFAHIKDLVVRREDRYLINSRNTWGNRYIRRKPIPRRIDIFSSPLDPLGNSVVREVLKFLKDQSASSTVTVSFHHLLLNNTPDKENRPLGLVEEEEALRRIALEIYHPKLLYPYLVAWAEKKASGYWEEALESVWLVHQQIKAQSKKDEVRRRLQVGQKLIEGIVLNQSVVFLVNNQEVVEVRNFDDFIRIYQNLSQGPE